MSAAPHIGRADTDVVSGTTHALYTHYGRQIYAYCFNQLRSREEAEDAVQTTFLNAFRGLQRGTVAQSEQAWLYKIAQNVCLARRQSSGRRLRLEAPNNFEVIQETVASPTQNGDVELMGLEEALEAMPENQRRAILLREWQGLSYREISDELGLTQASVEMLIFRARRSLANALDVDATPKKQRNAGRGLSIASLLAAIKSLFTGGAAVKIAVAVVATMTAVATEAEHTIVNPAPKTRGALSATALGALPASPGQSRAQAQAQHNAAGTAGARRAGQSGDTTLQLLADSSHGRAAGASVGPVGTGRAPRLTDSPPLVQESAPAPTPAAEPAPPAPTLQQSAPAAAPVATEAPKASPAPSANASSPASSPPQGQPTAAPKDSAPNDKGNAKASPTPTTAAPVPVAAAPAQPSDQGSGNNGNGKSNKQKDKAKGDDGRRTAAATPIAPQPVAAPLTLAATTTTAPTPLPQPVPTAVAPAPAPPSDQGNGKGNGNGKWNGKDNGNAAPAASAPTPVPPSTTTTAAPAPAPVAAQPVVVTPEADTNGHGHGNDGKNGHGK